MEDPVAVLEQSKDLEPIDRLRGIGSGAIPPPPIAVTLGIRDRRGERRVAPYSRFDPDEYHYNPIGTVHGGLAATLLDSAMGCAVRDHARARPRLHDARAEGELRAPDDARYGRVVCEATVVHRGGTIATAEGRLVAEETGKLLAHGTTTCLVFEQNRNGHTPQKNGRPATPGTPHKKVSIST